MIIILFVFSLYCAKRLYLLALVENRIKLNLVFHFTFPRLMKSRHDERMKKNFRFCILDFQSNSHNHFGLVKRKYNSNNCHNYDAPSLTVCRICVNTQTSVKEANERHQIALQKLRHEKLEAAAVKTKRKIMRDRALDKEKIRSATVAAMPTPEKFKEYFQCGCR